MPPADHVPGHDRPRWRLRALATVTALIGVGVPVAGCGGGVQGVGLPAGEPTANDVIRAAAG
jgi:hypothetical protein